MNKKKHVIKTFYEKKLFCFTFQLKPFFWGGASKMMLIRISPAIFLENSADVNVTFILGTQRILT